MPIYEYRCGNCGHDLEVLQKLTEPALTQCPECRTDALVKRISAAGFQLKGTGWYATDFRNGSKPAAKPEAKADKPAESKSADSKSSESTSTPAPSCGSGCGCH
jgi:putative FmdB family regulatory protein